MTARSVAIPWVPVSGESPRMDDDSFALPPRKVVQAVLNLASGTLKEAVSPKSGPGGALLSVPAEAGRVERPPLQHPPVGHQMRGHLIRVSAKSSLPRAESRHTGRTVQLLSRTKSAQRIGTCPSRVW